MNNQLNELHISSLVVQAQASYVTQVQAQIAALPHAEVSTFTPEGKIIVVIETKQQGFISELISTIDQLPHVMTTVMVYHEIIHDDPLQIPVSQYEQEAVQ